MPQIRKPDELHKLNSTYRKDRHGDPSTKVKADPINEIPKAPSYLSSYGKKEFERLVTNAQKYGLITDNDISALEMAAYYYEQYRQIIDELRINNSGKTKGALTYYLKGKNSQTHTLYKVLDQVIKSYLEIVYKFGVTPVERSKIVIQKNENKEIESASKYVK